MKTILTFGTYDLLQVVHVNMLEQLKALGDRLIVGVSTEEFNFEKGKQRVYRFAERARRVGALGSVDLVIADNDWSQKRKNIKEHKIDIFGIGIDWRGKFDELNSLCEVIYLPRADHISTPDLKKALSKIYSATIQQIKMGLDSVLDIVKVME